jgi:hypothetical protein
LYKGGRDVETPPLPPAMRRREPGVAPVFFFLEAAGN